MSEPYSKTALCQQCKVNRQGVLHQHLGQNGAIHYTWRCPVCQRIGCFGPPLFIPNEKIILHLSEEQIAALPVIMPDAVNRCVRCGKREAELHHWAPKEIFGDDAESWPKDHLCVECHMLWHSTINAARLEGKPS